jgi:hypothetical protein
MTSESNTTKYSDVAEDTLMDLINSVSSMVGDILTGYAAAKIILGSSTTTTPTYVAMNTM